MTLATILFLGALVVIATDRVDRTKVALAGAVLVLLTQTIEQEAAIDAVDSPQIRELAERLFREEALRLAAVARPRHLRGLEARLKLPA